MQLLDDAYEFLFVGLLLLVELDDPALHSDEEPFNVAVVELLLLAGGESAVNRHALFIRWEVFYWYQSRPGQFILGLLLFLLLKFFVYLFVVCIYIVTSFNYPQEQIYSAPESQEIVTINFQTYLNKKTDTDKIRTNMNSKKLRWKSDFNKEVVIENFNNRGWTKLEKEEDDWNIYWATVWNVRNIFNPKSGVRLNDGQIINHFPNHYELTRKDLMAKNIKRYKKQLEKNEHYLAKDDIWGNYHLDFIPQTYMFPSEYPIFLEQFQRNPNSTWIVKPNNKSQGQGIFLLKKINQLKKIAPGANLNAAFKNFNMNEVYVISRYVDNPLLIGGKKFDLRLYCLVTSYKPLKCYIYDQGFGRFCNELYTSDVTEIDNMFVHLTNVAIQMYSQKYSDKHGGKWSVKHLRFYLEMVFGAEKANKCFQEIHNIIIMSLKSVQGVIINDKHCFEMYGFDILLDANLKPWLIEVNASPSLSTTTKTDLDLKMNLIKEVYEIVIPEDWGEENGKVGTNTNTATKVGGFTVLYDEAQEALNRKSNIVTKKNSNKVWR